MRQETQVKPYHGYQVSRSGVIYSKASKGWRPLKQAINERGYPLAYLCFDGKTKAVKVHRLVAELFVPNPQGLKEVNHKDGNKLNNHADNLEWCTRSENVSHAYATGLRPTVPVAAYTLDGRLVRVFPSVKDAAAFCQVEKGGHIVAAARGKRKTAHGFIWKYVKEGRT